MHTELFLDLETFSAVDLKKHGVYRYAEGHSTEILLFGYAFDDEPVKVWDVTSGAPMPDDLAEGLVNTTITKIAQNSNFDRNVLKQKLVAIPIEQWEDTMVIAYTLSLPGSLERLLVSLGADVDFQKEGDGKRLVKQFCMPQKTTKNQPFERRDSLTDPDDWQRFIEYCRQDIVSMRWAYRKMPKWVISRDGRDQTQRELALWHLSERINDRGMPVDLDLARAAIKATDKEINRLNEELQQLTNGQVSGHSKRDAMLAWIRSYDVDIKGYTKEDLTDLLKQDLPPKVRRALEIRQEAGRTSTAKYQALIDATCADGRLRGGIQYYGAQRTGRYAGRRFQPHNLAHPEIPDSDNGAEALINDVVDLLFEESVMAVAVSCVRSCIKASPGKQLIVSDLSNIEGRDLAWLAGEHWKIKAFNDFDTIIGYDDKGKPIRLGPDLYMLSYHKSFGLPLADITYDERQIGKVQELSLQYQGGVGAFYKMAKKFNLDLEDVYDQVIGLATQEQLESAEWMVNWIRENRRDLDDLSDKGIIGADLVKQSWREAHPAIVRYWYQLEDMVRKAIENADEGLAFRAGKIKAMCRDGKLLIMLPSKRVLVYNRPGFTRDGTMYYKRYDYKKRKWHKSVLYGGLIAENCTQGHARDVLTYNMPAIDEVFPIIGTVHDEDVTEVDIDSPHTLEELNRMLVQHPPGTEGLPLAAAGYVAQRYRKD